MLKGIYTAIVTPFRNGQVDEEALQRIVEGQVKGGVDGIVPVGTTGESPTLSHDEHIRVIEMAVRFARGRVKVMAGTGANATSEAIELTRAAEEAGADATLQVAPYYNKPTQAGLYEHFAAVAGSTRLPVMLYSIPGRCGVEIGVDTCARLERGFKNVVGIKEAGGNADRVSQLRAACSPRFTILSGDDSLTLPFMAVGAQGVVSVATNVAPRAVCKMVRAFAAGDLKAAQRLHARLYPLFKDLFIETNPAPVKAALAILGQCTEEVRLPLVPVSDKSRAQIAETLKAVL